MERQPIVVGNWKMNGSKDRINKLLSDILADMDWVKQTQVVVCAPYVYLEQVARQLTGSAVAWGAQNINDQDMGAYTGEISGIMLKDFGCQYVIVGHSERRQYYNESDDNVAARFVAAKRHGLVPILCVGETQEQRRQAITMRVISQQMDVIIKQAGIAGFANSMIAYEPIWAIGSGLVATPDQAQEVHAMIRNKLATGSDTQIAKTIPILYGGSMKPDNAKELMSMPDIDGGLIGGASLKASEFIQICRVA